jgi:hypothetical protein
VADGKSRRSLEGLPEEEGQFLEHMMAEVDPTKFVAGD